MRALVAAAVAWIALLTSPAHAASPATTTWRGDPTRDNRVTGAPEPGLGVLWARDLGGAVSYPVVAGDTVFVTARGGSDAAYGTTVVALDLASGAVRWTRPVAGTYFWSGLAHDGGRLFVLDFDGDLTALNPATGATLWTRDLPGQYAFDSPPAARDGRVYAVGSGSGGTAYGVRATDGVVEWAEPLPTGGGSPAVDGTSAYVSLVCGHAYAFDRASGATRWEHHGDCTGGGDVTPAVHGGRVYPLGDNGAIYSAATGAVVGAADFHGAPAFADGTAYVPWSGSVLAVDAASWAGRWTSSVGGLSAEAPLVSGSHLYAGSTDGFVVALRRSDGTAVWCASTAGEPVGTGTPCRANSCLPWYSRRSTGGRAR
jgi:outer membrane protein assembly factor BamB